MVESIRVVSRDVGRILEALSLIMFASIAVAIAWGEEYTIPALLISGAIPLAIGYLLTRLGKGAAEPGKLHGMVIAAAGWFLVAVFGSLPFFFVAATDVLHIGVLGSPPITPTTAAFLNPLNGIFESMSGFTGTGLTMAVHENHLPHVLQWWRSLIEWVGGVGVIVLTTAILARPGSGSLTLYESEARSEKIHPSIVSTVRTIWWIFLLFTVASVTLLWLAGMPLWDAINHAMTGLATGGFSITDNSIATYHSALVDFATVPVMVLGSIAFPVHYLVMQGNLDELWTDLQTRWVFGFFGLGTLVLTVLLAAGHIYSTPFQDFRYALFQFVSAASCTGFQTAGSLGTSWSVAEQLVVSLGMVVGAAAGSTVGGIKLIRAATLTKGTLFRIRGVFYPESVVRHFHMNGRSLSEGELAREFEEAAIISFLWFVFLGIGIFALILTVDPKYTLENAIFEVASAQGNVGLSTGITGPGMPTLDKVVFLFNMWIGRLEIIPVLVLLRALVTGFEVSP
ncbi:potassium uptake protein TrkH [Halarchaeum acidiphilum MH1-52-1]|uniref:Potassium uptake protein TrkH n=1 Tax=Halarchaeum acidiphilum MH1-52-1 TaxID=1261545 RepID=U2YUG9_9EURY|nr:TrkH family potassium uptake protein [Halarchaeum acidiphilum]GAD52382.1 potassium uptake protein TrkH [Halarchaeum acidiphilum MH1-52-1]